MMENAIYDPAKEPMSCLYSPPCGLCRFCTAGPGGNSTLTENNEKGILQEGLFEIIRGHKYAAMGSNHDSFRQGIYTTNSAGDRD
jgi:Zn-dependent alcohol dehydrogenase